MLVRKNVVAEASGGGPRAFSISVDGRRVDLSDQIPSSELDIHSVQVSTSTFDALGDDATLGLSGSDLARNDESAGGTLSMRGFSTELAKLQKGCDASARNVVAAAPAVPSIPAMPTVPPAASPAEPIPYLDAKPVDPLSPQARPAAAPAAISASGPTTAQSVANVAGSRIQSEPAQKDCSLQIADAPEHVTGRVTGLLSGEEAAARTQSVEARLGAKVSPAYVLLERVTVDRYPRGGVTMAAIPESMAVKIGDLVELNSRYRDQSLPCHFIPWTINRLVGHVE